MSMRIFWTSAVLISVTTSAYIMTSGIICPPPGTLGAEFCRLSTAMLRFTDGKTPRPCSRHEVSTEVDLQVHFSPRAARIFISSGSEPRRISWNRDRVTLGAQCFGHGQVLPRVRQWLYSDRTARRNRHHRRFGCIASARSFARQSQSPSNCLPEQPQATPSRLDHVRRGQQRLACSKQPAESL